MNSIRERLREFIEQNFYVERCLGENDSLVESGTVDSTGVLEVIAYIEDQYGIVVADSEVLAENFDTVAQIVRYVESKLEAARIDLDFGEKSSA